jgi:transcriptional regulator with XRE-family HTH domain
MDATLEKLLEIAEKRGFTQQKLETEAKLPPNRLSRLKQSKLQVAPRFDEVAAMARVVGVSLDELAYGVVGDPDRALLDQVVTEIGAGTAFRWLIAALKGGPGGSIPVTASVVAAPSPQATDSGPTAAPASPAPAPSTARKKAADRRKPT